MDAFLKVREEVEKLNEVDVQAVYFLVKREENKDADRLANDGIRIGPEAMDRSEKDKGKRKEEEKSGRVAQQLPTMTLHG